LNIHQTFNTKNSYIKQKTRDARFNEKKRAPCQLSSRKWLFNLAGYSELDNICVWQTLSLHSFA
ncbi:hypothetical protein RAD16_40415, partial [Bradyrhizobium sp. 18BD]